MLTGTDRGMGPAIGGADMMGADMMGGAMTGPIIGLPQSQGGGVYIDVQDEQPQSIGVP